MAKSTGTVTTADGVVLHYETIGQPTASRPSLVFHHYYGGSPATYRHVVSQPCLAGYHKVLYHARGWFPSTGPGSLAASASPRTRNPKPFGIEALSSDLGAIISATTTVPGSAADHQGEEEAKGVGAGVVVIGHSMGAKVAQHYAATSLLSSSSSSQSFQSSPSNGSSSNKGKLNIKGLILVSPAPLRGLRLPDDAKRQQLSAYKSASGVRSALEHVLTAASQGGSGLSLSEEDVQQCVRDSMRGSEEATAAWPTYGCEEDFGFLEERLLAESSIANKGNSKGKVEGESESERLKVLVLRGDKDFERDLVDDDELGKAGEKGRWFVVTKRVLLPNCGHLIPLEKPEVLAQEIKAFLDGL